MSLDAPPCPVHRGFHACPPATCDRVRVLEKRVSKLKRRISELESGEEQVRFQLAHLQDCIAWVSHNCQLKKVTTEKPCIEEAVKTP